jgi:hypothetical protein
VLIVGLGACSAASEEEEAETALDAFSQSQVDDDPVLKALQARAADVDQYEINVDDIEVPVANASVGASVNGYSTRGLDWFKNPQYPYGGPAGNKSWDQGSPTGKKCQWAAIFRFQHIFTDPPQEALDMLGLRIQNADGTETRGRWSGSFWSWTDDYASTDSPARAPTASYAWSSGLWKWIGSSGAGGVCLLPTRAMVAGMMKSCREVAEGNGGDPKGCRMPSNAEAPSQPFCASALCGPGTTCDEAQRACVALDPFCPAALCGPGTTCSEEQRACVPD